MQNHKKEKVKIRVICENPKTQTKTRLIKKVHITQIGSGCERI